MSSELDFGRHFGVPKGLNLGFSRFGSGFGPFLTERVRSLDYLEGFKWVENSVLVDRPGFKFHFNLSCLKQFEVRYISIRSNTRVAHFAKMCPIFKFRTVLKS